MPAVLVALMVVVMLLFGLGIVVLGSRALKAEAERVRAARPTSGRDD